MWDYEWIIEPRNNIAVFQENISIDTGKMFYWCLQAAGFITTCKVL